MDIYDYLKLDHAHVNRLFKQFDNTDSGIRKKQIVDLISEELLAHAHSEQKTFYEALLHDEESKEEAEHGQKEHHEIEDQISLIQSAKRLGPEWVKKVHKLQEIVEHHVKEEEGPIFNKAKKVLSEKQACALKEQMHYLKMEYLLKIRK